MQIWSALQTGVRRWLDRRGYILAGKWHLHHVVFAHDLRLLLEALHVDCVFDVGANEGQYVRFLRDEVNYRGLILSFEPISTIAERLKAKSAADAQWKVHHLALGERDGTAAINVMRGSDMSSFLKPTSEVTDRFSRANEIVRTEETAIKALRALMPELRREHRFARPYLKLDTQGYDLMVLRGAGPELAAFVALQTELSFRRLYEGAPDWTEIITFLQEKAFSVSEFSRIFQQNILRKVEMDCVLVNDRFIGADELPAQHGPETPRRGSKTPT